MASRGCLHPANAICYVRGQFIKTKTRKYSVKACRKMCEAYKAYFGMPVGDQHKSWAPHSHAKNARKLLKVKWTIAACLDQGSWNLAREGHKIGPRSRAKMLTKIIASSFKSVLLY